MKKLAFILVVALSGTLNAQNTFENGVKSELSKWNLTQKNGDKDSLIFALLQTLFTDPATNYEFDKINPRIVTEVFVTFQIENGDIRQLTFTEWIQKEVRVLDSTKWNIKFETSSYDVFDSKIRSEVIKLTNNLTGQTRQIFINYNDDSLNGSVINMFTIVDQRFN
jgi:hypothetical protein